MIENELTKQVTTPKYYIHTHNQKKKTPLKQPQHLGV